MTAPRIVIVGAGLAGLRAAERLRENGWTGDVVIVGDENVGPYSRPALSKQLLEGRMQPAELALDQPGPVDAEFRLGATASGLDPGRHLVALTDGTELAYDGLIIATGVCARQLPSAPNQDRRVLTLRTLDDARRLDEVMAGARRLAIIGGGFVGCEVASTARARALEVTIIDMAPTLMGRALGADLGLHMTDLHHRHGVELRLGTGITSWETGKKGVSIGLNGGEQIDVDAVLVGIGVVPRVEWLEGNGLDLTDGVLCDATSRVVGLDDVVAAGDVARWPNLRFDNVPRRVEHWIHAIEHGRAAADTLLAGTSAQPFMPVPRFWSEQHGVRLQAAGMPSLGDRVALAEGSPQSGPMVLAYLRNDRLVGVVGLDSPRALLHYGELVHQATWPAAAEFTGPRPVNDDGHGAPDARPVRPHRPAVRSTLPPPVHPAAARSAARTRPL